MRLQPSNSDFKTLHQLGLEAFTKKEWKTAEKYYRIITEKGPVHPYYFNQLGCIARITGNDEQAIACFKQALHIDPTF
jgi:tetratricopeptide (TPR) repeat protein